MEGAKGHEGWQFHRWSYHAAFCSLLYHEHKKFSFLRRCSIWIKFVYWKYAKIIFCFTFFALVFIINYLTHHKTTYLWLTFHFLLHSYHLPLHLLSRTWTKISRGLRMILFHCHGWLHHHQNWKIYKFHIIYRNISGLNSGIS